MVDESGYVFAGERDGSRERFRTLAELYDGPTQRYLEALGVARKWQCLEVGAGGGSVARWLAGRVSPGDVVATDRDVSALRGATPSNLEVTRHDIALDPLPEAAFDLVHARLVLMHLADPGTAMDKMIRAARPGGWILFEEFDASPPGPEDSELALPKTSLAFRAAMERSGVDTRFGRRLPLMMRAHGLESIGGEARTSLWTAAGAAAGLRLMRANYIGLRDAMVDTGYVRADDIDADLARLKTPAFMTVSPTMWSVWGRVPRVTPR